MFFQTLAKQPPSLHSSRRARHPGTIQTKTYKTAYILLLMIVYEREMNMKAAFAYKFALRNLLVLFSQIILKQFLANSNWDLKLFP